MQGQPAHTQHQAQGLQRMFSGHAASLVSVLAGPSAPDSQAFILSLAAGLSARGQRVCLVETMPGKLSDSLGCRPLMPWQPGRTLDERKINAGGFGLLHAPGCMAGDAALADAAASSRNCDCVLFDGGRFSTTEVALEPATVQTLVLLLGERDAEAGYALVKALKATGSPARLLLMGETANSVAQAAKYFMQENLESRKIEADVCQIGNSKKETSSNTLTLASNLAWVVARITQNDQPKVAHGSSGKGAEEVYKR